ncbi:hypothetical protein L0668_12580 [Paraglaciecola aquimarina]|uniref:Uncharacterized protein n=1 Tax=Paraglaciecola algarum TaxID=3050085 RepID=A0ABS9D8A9_9ALTE|nr:hypothetical protein [Paraglaciecola sp. G1-23]MCF2948949.1 hypothetical protein [Paraglaciecola sp. G1-23]
MINDWSCRFNNVKAILQLKKSINFGDVSLNFETVAKTLKELEGTFIDGFENNIKYLLNSNHWNANNLVAGKPSISLRSRMDEYAFELHCFPIVKDEAQAVVVSRDPNSPFTEYNPASFGPLLKINGLNNLISMAVRKGDDADMELIKYAHMMTEQLITLFTKRLNVTERTGKSVKDFFEMMAEDEAALKSV